MHCLEILKIAYGGFAFAYNAEDNTGIIPRMMMKIELIYEFAITECAKDKQMNCLQAIKDKLSADIAQSESEMQKVEYKNDRYKLVLEQLKRDLNDVRFTEIVVRALTFRDLWSSILLNLDLRITDIDVALSEYNSPNNCAIVSQCYG